MPLPLALRSKNNVVWDCTYHVVFCPKYRRPVLRQPIAVRLKEIILQVADETRSDLIELEVLPDHVHLKCRVDPQVGIARVVRLMKGRSSRLLRQEFPELRRRSAHPVDERLVRGDRRARAESAAIKRYIEEQKGR